MAPQSPTAAMGGQMTCWETPDCRPNVLALDEVAAGPYAVVRSAGPRDVTTVTATSAISSAATR